MKETVIENVISPPNYPYDERNVLETIRAP
jgi:hypothetical protein